MRVMDKGVYKPRRKEWQQVRMCRIGLREKVAEKIRDANFHIDDIINPQVEKEDGETPAEFEFRRKNACLTGFEFFERRREVLSGCQIVFTTLGSTRKFLTEDGAGSFDLCIMDEVSQSVEPQALVPLSLDCKRCVLVGDPAQLRATVLSRVCMNAGYDGSLMDRVLANGVKACLLDTQYRMHPDISTVISKLFYQDRLKTAPENHRR